jgi:hypothetical protein
MHTEGEEMFMSDPLNPAAIVRQIAEGLDVLGKKINAAHEAGKKAVADGKEVRKGAREAGERTTRSALEHFAQTGLMLIQAQDRIHKGGGEWLVWLKANVDFSQQTASRYMKYVHCLQLQTDESVCNLPLERLKKAWRESLERKKTWVVDDDIAIFRKLVDKLEVNWTDARIKAAMSAFFRQLGNEV